MKIKKNKKRLKRYLSVVNNTTALTAGNDKMQNQHRFTPKNNAEVSLLGLCVLWVIYVVDGPVVQIVNEKVGRITASIKAVWNRSAKRENSEELYRKAKERYGVYKANPVFMYKYDAYKRVWG